MQTTVLRKFFEPIYNFIKKIMFRIKLIQRDLIWDLGYHSCFNPFPPSFYYTHTDEEIEQMIKDMPNRLRSLIEEKQTETYSVSGNEEETLKLEGKLEDKPLGRINTKEKRKQAIIKMTETVTRDD